MELKIGVQEMGRALARSQGIVEKKSTMPILSHVLLEAKKGGELDVSATDLDVAVSGEHKCEVLKEGAVAVSAKHLYEIVKALPEASLTIKKAQNNYVEVKSGAAEFKIVGLPAEDFPALPKFDKVHSVSIDPKILLEMIDHTGFAVSTDETRYNLNGVYFEPAGAGGVRMVATDGHRLSLIEKKLEGDFKIKKGVILPKKGLFELKRLLAEIGESGEEKPDCKLGFVENNAIFKRPGLVMSMRLIDGQFPDYQQVIPKDGEKVVILGRLRLLETLKRVSLLSSEKAHAVKIELTKGQLKVLSQNPDLGEAKEELTVDYKGGDLKIGFNARYLIDVLTVLKCDDVSFELADELSPGVIRPAGDKGFIAVIMPMRI
jgi:DNA polymerase-3 subunit beta